MQSYMTAWFALCVQAQDAGGRTVDAGARCRQRCGPGRRRLGSALGLHVVAAASTEEKRALAEKLGAEATIDTAALDAAGVKDAAKEFAASFAGAAGVGGVDHLYDPSAANSARRACAPSATTASTW